MATNLDELKVEVEDINTVADSAIALMDGLKTKLDAAIATGNMAKVAEISAALGAQKQELADAIVRNTPVEPTP